MHSAALLCATEWDLPFDSQLRIRSLVLGLPRPAPSQRVMECKHQLEAAVGQVPTLPVWQEWAVMHSCKYLRDGKYLTCFLFLILIMGTEPVPVG